MAVIGVWSMVEFMLCPTFFCLLYPYFFAYACAYFDVELSRVLFTCQHTLHISKCHVS